MFTRTIPAIIFSIIMLAATAAFAQGPSSQGEELYKYLSQKTITEGDAAFVDWPERAVARARLVGGEKNRTDRQPPHPEGEGGERRGRIPRPLLHTGHRRRPVRALPARGRGTDPGRIRKMSENRMTFALETVAGKHGGRDYTFARISGEPKAILFDRIFKISIVLMLFFVMVGMGLTLKLSDFTIVFKQAARHHHRRHTPVRPHAAGRPRPEPSLRLLPGLPVHIPGAYPGDGEPGGRDLEPADTFREGRPGPLDLSYLDLNGAGPFLHAASPQAVREHRHRGVGSGSPHSADHHRAGHPAPGHGHDRTGPLGKNRAEGCAHLLDPGHHHGALHHGDGRCDKPRRAGRHRALQPLVLLRPADTGSHRHGGGRHRGAPLPRIGEAAQVARL